MRLPWQFDEERWRREHYWDQLGRYNAEVSRGIVHTPEWEAAMRREQASFDAEHGCRRGTGLPFTLNGTG